MTRYTRVGAIYRKELISILRDKRTMIAMVIIPVVLYPLVMLGFVRAMESEHARLRKQTFVVEVDDQTTASGLEQVIDIARQGDDTPEEKQAAFNIRVGGTPSEKLGDEVQLRVALDVTTRPYPLPPRLGVKLTYNEINPRSQAAWDEMSRVFGRYGDRLTRGALSELLGNRPTPAGAEDSRVDQVLRPVEIETESVATEEQRGGWALGLIIPVMLVLMTITGAVYPAIDLTAGERERGTLEALLATPVPILHVIVAKFLVVATVGMFAALVTMASVGATMHFGGMTQALSAMPVEFPARALPIILLCMVPFALLTSAMLIAACSFARSFKEAQNYVMPVIIIAMIPAIGVTLPSVKLQGVMLVMPVGNMVLLTRELFKQNCQWTQVVVVLLSTTLYAAAAVGVAARLFGQEATLFADAGSYRAMFRRQFFKPRATPTASQALLLAALLFPATFYANGLLAGKMAEGFIPTMRWLAVVQFLGLFVLVPVALAVYLKIDVAHTCRLGRLPARAWLAALLIGGSSWILARQFFVLQSMVLAPSESLKAFSELVEPQLAAAPIALVVFLLAIVPAVCEEFLFRGFLLSGVGSSFRKWPAILTVALVFSIFHFMIDRMPVTALLGVMLGYLCWQCRSIWPGILVHVLHNGTTTVIARFPEACAWLGFVEGSEDSPPHLPARVLIPALVVFVMGLAIIASIRDRRR